MPRHSKKVDVVEFRCDNLVPCNAVVERRGMSWELPKGWWTYQNRFFHSLDHLADTLAQEIGQETKDVRAVILEIHIDRTDGTATSSIRNNERSHGAWQQIKR